MEKSNILYLYSYVYELFIFFTGLLVIGLVYFIPQLVLGSLFSLVVLLFFYRNNLTLKREAINKSNFLSPASNKITRISYQPSDTIISSYLSPFDKHFMIAPCDCTVIDKIYKPQRNSDAECMRHVCIDTYGNKFYMDQIVSKPLHWGWIPSLLYNRCVSFVNIGTTLKQGERFGLIRFGSNMEYSVPGQYSVSPNILHKWCSIATILGSSQ